MQMFHKNVENAIQGDRLGVCLTQFDPKALERGIVCSPGTLPTAFALVVNVEKVVYFKQPIRDKFKFHITLGHETVMAKMNLFESECPSLNFESDYSHTDEITDTSV